MTNDPPAPGRDLLSVRGLTKQFPVERNLLGRPTRIVHAINGIDLDITEGETLGLVGESGCGKTTVGRALLRLIAPSGGHACFQSRTFAESGQNGSVDIFSLGARDLRKLRRDMQIVFQDPFSSLNPRLTVATNIAEPLRANGVAKRPRTNKVDELLADVGLDRQHGKRYPHQLSGGQRQRVAIARALALDPQFIVADEPVSSLDVSIQAQILNLILELQKKRGLALLFIGHNLAVIRYVSHRVAVMYLGKIVEIAGTDELFARPRHPYTQALIDSVPRKNFARHAVSGELPDPMNPPGGCPFHPRCQFAQDRCRSDAPDLRTIAGTHQAACHFAEELHLGGAREAVTPKALPNTPASGR